MSKCVLEVQKRTGRNYNKLYSGQKEYLEREKKQQLHAEYEELFVKNNNCFSILLVIE